ncbi:MAG: exodeoxyribonuclease VII small subunit [Oscillospiraceae bacterium]|nr:exodeoxyribonuclease VII small subunit [Oscillospiraceae bacterium]
MKFEKGMQELSSIIAKLEDGGLPLEEAVKLYGKGAKLAADCRKELDQAKLTVSTFQEKKTNAEGETDHDNNI